MYISPKKKGIKVEEKKPTIKHRSGLVFYKSKYPRCNVLKKENFL